MSGVVTIPASSIALSVPEAALYAIRRDTGRHVARGQLLSSSHVYLRCPRTTVRATTLFYLGHSQNRGT